MRRKRRGRVVGAIAIVFIVVVLAIAAFAAMGFVRAKSVSDHAKAAGDALSQVVSDLQNDPQQAAGHLRTAQGEISAAQDELGKVPLPQMAFVPDVGRNIAASSALLDQISTVTYDSMPVFVSAAEVFDFSSGRLRQLGSDPSTWGAQLKKAGASIKDLPHAIDVLTHARDEVGRIDTAGLLPPVANAVKKASRSLDEGVKMVAPAKSAAGDLAGAIDDGRSVLDALGGLVRF